MVNILTMYSCSGNSFENNPTTEYVLTSQYLASSLFHRPELEIEDLDYHDGIRDNPVEVSNQGFYGSGSVSFRTGPYEVIICFFPRSDRNDGHVNLNLFYYIKRNGVCFDSGIIRLPLEMHQIDAHIARIRLVDQNGRIFSDKNIPL